MSDENEADTLVAIDVAIKAHVKAMFERDDSIDVLPLVTGWVVAFEVQSLEDGMVVWDNGYAVAETTSRNSSVGLAVWMADELREIRADANEEDDE